MKIKHIIGLQSKLDEKINTSTIIDEDDMISNSDQRIPTQQSVKAYVDSISGVPSFSEMIEEFSPSVEILVGEEWVITLTYPTKVGHVLDVTLNGEDILTTQFENIPPSNSVTIKNMLYPIETDDIIKIIYKY